jgi:aminopeptidase N
VVQTNIDAENDMVRPGPDPHSYAQPDEARVTHVALDLDADFETMRFAGTAALSFERSANAAELVLDTRDLEIEAVFDRAGESLEHRLEEGDAVLGRPLVIRLRPDTDEAVVHYRTRPDAAALQWLRPEQTAGRRMPFLFTQGQAILTRTWVPTQDSPGIRQTYTARIRVPAGLTAVMAAETLTPAGIAEVGHTTFEFGMPEPVPAYLFALAIGELEFRPVGRRTGVWAEPPVVDAAADELADLEDMLEAAEELYGPYRWGRHDVLILPPSFPLGGMENPRLTFATPTILAGDRSLVSLVAHELAHSWSGNLVTNATWNDFWLNEGFTVYFERRIMERLRGPAYAAMLDRLGRQELADEIARLGPDSPDTRLAIDLAGRDPDDGVTRVPYEKGAAFLRTIEAVVGRERFDAFLRRYFDAHAFQSMTTPRFLEELRADLLAGDTAAERAIRIDDWVHQPGVPDNAPIAASDAFERVEAQVQRFVAGTAAAGLETAGWSTHEWVHFLRGLPENLPRTRLEELDRAFGLTESGNCEIKFEWLRIAVRSRYEEAFPALERFLTGQGRRKYLKPLYEELMKSEEGREMARRIYGVARPGYHSVSTNTIDAIVGRQ